MENAKMKLLKELKEENILEVEDLDEVAAGSCYDMSTDSKFLNVLMRGHPKQPDRYGATKCWFNVGYSISKELAAAWAVFGIRYAPSSSTSDESAEDHFLYTLDATGGRVSRQEAWAFAEAIMGKHLERKDWDW